MTPNNVDKLQNKKQEAKSPPSDRRAESELPAFASHITVPNSPGVYHQHTVHLGYICPVSKPSNIYKPENKNYFMLL